MNTKTFISKAQEICHDLSSVNLVLRASALSFTTLIGIVPALIISFGVVTILSNAIGFDYISSTNQIQKWLYENASYGVAENVTTTIQNLVSGFDPQKIGIAGLVGLILSLGLLLRQVEIAFNATWRINIHRNMFKRLAKFFVIKFVLFLSIAILLRFTVSIEDQLHSNTHIPYINIEFSSMLFFGLLVLFFTTAYKTIPNTHVSIVAAGTGGMIGSVCFIGSGILYSWITQYLTNYQTLYGVFASIPLFLVWLNIVWTVVLLGCFISWKIQEIGILGTNILKDAPAPSSEDTSTLPK